MATFVGASTVYDAGTSWPSSLTFGTSDLAAGVQVGDRLVLLVTVFYSRRTFPTPVDTTLNSFNGLSGWDFIRTAQFTTSGLTNDTFTQVWAYTRRYASGDLPLTATPLDPSGNPYTPINATSSTYRLCLAAWRPSYGWSGRTNARDSDGQFNNATLSPNTGISAYGENAGQFVEATFLSSGDSGSVVTANGFTVQHTQASITNRGGSLTIADKAFTASGSTSAMTLTKPTGPNGATVLFALDQQDPSLNGWSVGRIKF